MRRACTFLIVVLFLVSPIAVAADVQVAGVTRPDVPSFVGYVEDEIIVEFTSEVGKIDVVTTPSGVVAIGNASVDALAAQFRATELRPIFPGESPKMINGQFFDLSRFQVVRFTNGKLDDVLAAYSANPMVKTAEPIAIHAVSATPNDGFYSSQWHLNRANDKDIDAPEAWDIETGDTGIKVAVLDTGVRYYHKDLGGSAASASTPTAADGNMWLNLAEKNGTAGVDDDGNGYIDDWVGWDFVTGVTGCWSGEDCSTADNDPRDFNGHGTHCAGNVAAINNNGYASCAAAGGWGNGTNQPTANGVKVMALRIGWSGSYLGQEVGYVRMDFAASALNYAANKGAKAASCSWGSSSNTALNTAINAFVAQGGLIFKAAGNDGSQTADYMCARTDVESVVATDTNDCKANFSTYGTWADISAPGTGILSSYHNHADPTPDYVATMDGTSMATPITASVAALIWSKNPTWTRTQVRDTLYATADNIYGLPCNSAYAGKLGAGRVNAFRAVSAGTTCNVAANFVGSPTSGCAPLTVNFTDQSTGPVIFWSWTFGDGGTSTAQNPSHQYTSAGTYSVSLTVTSSTCNNTFTRTNYVTVSAAPVASFVGSPTSGYVPLTVNFTDQSTGSPTSWLWDFGDLGTSTAQNPSHVYTTAGTYTVTLTATNACGSDQEQKVGYITASTPPAQQCDDFADGNITDWGNSVGTWTATGGYMKGNSSTTNAQRTSPFGSFATPKISCDVRMNTGRNQRNARIIFNYVNSSNYRFIEGDDVNNRWRIYERVSGTNTVRATYNTTINTATWYPVEVSVAASGATTLKVNGSSVLSYTFSSTPSGLVGCGFTKSNSDFDNFCVGASGAGLESSKEELTLPSVAKSVLPEGYALDQNRPNPFNPSTNISYLLGKASDVTLTIYNVLGERITTLVDDYQTAGRHEVVWNGTNNAGRQVASGVYFYRLDAGAFTETKKMVLMK